LLLGKSAQALPQDALRASARVAKVLEAGEPYRAIKVAVSALQRNPQLDKGPLLNQINDILITLKVKLDKLIPNDLRGANKIGFYETLVQAIATKNNHTNLRFILLEDLADLYKSTNPDKAIALLQERLALVNSPNTQVRNVLEKLAGLHVAKKEYSKAIQVSKQMEAEVVRVIQSIEQATSRPFDPLIHNHRLSSDLRSIRTSIVTLAQRQHEAQNSTDAIQTLLELLSRDPENPNALLQLAQIGKDLNRQKLTQDSVQRYLKTQPNCEKRIEAEALLRHFNSPSAKPTPPTSAGAVRPASAAPAPTAGAGTAPVAQAPARSSSAPARPASAGAGTATPQAPASATTTPAAKPSASGSGNAGAGDAGAPAPTAPPASKINPDRLEEARNPWHWGSSGWAMGRNQEYLSRVEGFRRFVRRVKGKVKSLAGAEAPAPASSVKASAQAGAGAQAPAGRVVEGVQAVTPQVIPSADPIPSNLQDAGQTNVASLKDLSQGEDALIDSRGSTATEHKKRKGLRLLLHDLRVRVVALLTGDDDKLLSSLGEFDE
jgi:tetratricopeptide (TPR) repeat protein